MNMSSYKLKGCYVKDINILVKNKLVYGLDITSSINIMVIQILNLYTIKDCINIIINRGDLHDAYVKCYNRLGGDIDTSNKLQFHRDLAFYYVNEIVNLKIDEKIAIFMSNEEKDECVICLEEINKNDTNSMKKTGCNHTFHLNCLIEWKRRCSTCPICRNSNI